MDPLWKLNSGRFAGWRVGEWFYDAKGVNRGFFRGDVLYALNGEYLADVQDGEWLARRRDHKLPAVKGRESRGALRAVPRADRSGRPSKIYMDPEI